MPVIDRVIRGVGPGLPLVLAGPPGCGRTVIALQITAAALKEHDIVAFLSSEPAPLLLQQATSLGCDLARSVVEEQLILLELDPIAPASFAASGGKALIESVRDEHPAVSWIVVDPFTMLTADLMDEAPLRASARDMIAATPRTSLVLSVETDRPGLDAPVERVLAEVCGTYLSIDRAADGLRTLTVTKTRAGAGRAESVEFRIGSTGAELVREIARRGGDETGRATPAAVAATSAPPPSPRIVDALGPAHPVQAPASPVGGAQSPPVSSPASPAGEPPGAAITSAEPQAVAVADAPDALPSVLIVDDDLATRERFLRWLGERYRVEVAADGFEAMTRMFARRPDLVVLDLEMPRVSGFELLSALHGVTEGLRILAVLPGPPDRAGDRMGPLVMGASEVIAKPVDRFDLVHKAEMLLRLSGPPPRLVDPEDARGFFDFSGHTRALTGDRFRSRLTRAKDFGARYGVASSVAALAAPNASVLDRLVAAADETLRFEDAIHVLSKRRLLALLIAAETEHAAPVLDRLLRCAAQDDPLPRIQSRVVDASDAAEESDWRVFFRDLEEEQPGEERL